MDLDVNVGVGEDVFSCDPSGLHVSYARFCKHHFLVDFICNTYTPTGLWDIWGTFQGCVVHWVLHGHARVRCSRRQIFSRRVACWGMCAGGNFVAIFLDASMWSTSVGLDGWVE